MFAASKTDSASTGGYQISRSLRFNSPDSTNVQRTFSTTGTSQTTSTLSMWFKRGDISRNQRIFDCYDGSSGSSTGVFLDNDVITLDYGRGSGAKLVTTQVLRDVSAWYHLVAVFDSSNATSSNRLKLYLNGSQITTFSTAIYPSQNALNNWMSANSNNRIGSAWDGSANFSGYITEVNFIDGQALTPSSFGETNAQTGVWQPKAYSGSYGTNGFYLNFSDNSNTTAATLGKDYSGNGNNWTPNNFSVTAGAGNDSMVDVPTPYGVDTGAGGNVRGNYSTLNPLNTAYTDKTFSNGNLDVTGSTTNQVGGHSTMQIPTTGQWYAECVMTAYGSGSPFIGVNGGTTTLGASGASYRTDGTKELNGTGSSYGATWTTNDVIGIAVDTSAGSITFYKNGTSQGVAYTTLNTNFTNGLFFSCQGAAGTTTFVYNFGQRPFAYTAPSGYKALCTQNLPTPTIGATSTTLANLYFNPVLYTGDRTDRTITVGFQPDWVWVKSRNAVDDHYLMNAVVGTGKYLSSNSTASEFTNANTLTAYTSTGFSVGNTGTTNETGRTYVAWNWKANGSGSTNTAGQITSTVSANTTSGFSIVTFTTDGTTKTVGHGLGVKPSLIIAKVRSGAGSWIVMTDIINGSMQYGTLNTTNAFASIGYSAPTSTVFQYNDNNGNTQVAYCFASIEGYSKIGTYTGNGSADGPFVYCGFKPRYVLFKDSSNATWPWIVVDTARNTYNVMNAYLSPNNSNAEATNFSGNAIIDSLSNGFKVRSSDAYGNTNGDTYIFMAFAESPFKYSLAR